MRDTKIPNRPTVLVRDMVKTLRDGDSVLLKRRWYRDDTAPVATAFDLLAVIRKIS